MPCYHPMKGYRARTPNASGKYSIVFNPRDGYKDMPLEIACGQCTGCRLERSRQWAIRCVKEASLHDENTFITLTYNEETIPENGSLQKQDFQKFMKRLRKKIDKPIKYYMAGEYGEETNRPHYHACIFNFDFNDKELFKMYNGNPLYISDTLDSLWPLGHHTIGQLTFETAAYTARYCMKKVMGKGLDAIDETTGLKPYEKINYYGEIIQIQPEYNNMSLKPAIAREWIDQYGDETFVDDKVIVRGKEMTPPEIFRAKVRNKQPTTNGGNKSTTTKSKEKTSQG